MGKFTNEGIQTQLAKVLTSSQLSGSPVLTEFLTFIVNETIAGRGPELKEYTIGVSALKKEASFNPQLDGIVRIHAGRLRRALKEYYYEEGKDDPIVINIPKGSYHPTFDIKDNLLATHPDIQIQSIKSNHVGVESKATQHRARKHKPSVAVLPFKRIGQGSLLNFLTNSIGEFLSTELTQFDQLRVISYYSSNHIPDQAIPIRRLGSILNADYLFTGSVQFYNEKVRVCVQLNHCASAEQLWARTFDQPDDGRTLLEFQSQVVDIIIGSVLGLSGIISRQEVAEQIKNSSDTPQENSGYYALASWYSRYARNFDFPTIRQARKYYDQILNEEPDNAVAMAFLSEIYSGEALLLQGNEASIESGSYYANKALRIDPYCQQAYQALAINKLIQRQNDECVQLLEEGFLLNPKSLDYKASMGSIMIFCGNFDRGVQILEEVIHMKAPLFWWQILSYSYYAYYKKNYHEALYWADRVEMDVVWALIIKAASYGQLDQPDQARQILSELAYNYPKISIRDTDTLKKLFYSETLLSEIMRGLVKVEYA